MQKMKLPMSPKKMVNARWKRAGKKVMTNIRLMAPLELGIGHSVMPLEMKDAEYMAQTAELKGKDLERVFRKLGALKKLAQREARAARAEQVQAQA